jgi:ferrous iron transport protein A
MEKSKVVAEEARLLNMIKPGQVVRLVSITAGHMLQTRRASMGLLPGTMLEVVKNSEHGPVVILVKGSRLMLGRGMSNKILVA